MFANFRSNPAKWIVSAACLLFSTPGFSEVSLIFGVPNVEIGGDMDGETLVSGGGSAEILPNQDDGSGTKFGIGAFSDEGSLEFTWVQTDHDGDFVGIPTESEFESFNFDAKFAVAGENKLKALAIVGIGIMSVKVEDGSTDGFRLKDAKFKGFDFRFGAGARYRMSKNLAFEANAIYRYGSYDRVDGIVSGDISDTLDGDGLTTSFELVYIFAK